LRDYTGNNSDSNWEPTMPQMVVPPIEL